MLTFEVRHVSGAHTAVVIWPDGHEHSCNHRHIYANRAHACGRRLSFRLWKDQWEK